MIAGFTGSLMVIAVNAWMNHPAGFALVGGHVVDVHPLTALFGNSFLWHELMHMYIAGYIVTGFLVAGAYAIGRLRGRWGRYERTALAIPLTIAALASPVQVLVGDWAARDVATHAADQARRARGPRADDQGRARAPARLVRRRTGQVRDRDPEAALAARLPRPRTRPSQGLDAVPADRRPPVNVVRIAFQTMVGIGTLLALLGVVAPRSCASGAGACPSRPWFYRARRARRAGCRWSR